MSSVVRRKTSWPTWLSVPDLRAMFRNAPLDLMVLLFCGVSGAVNILVAQKIGGSGPQMWTFIALAVGAQLVIALLPTYTLGRKHYVAFAIGLVVWLPCILYSWSSALEFFDGNLSDASARSSKVSSDYGDAKDRLDKLRLERRGISTMRGAAIVRQKITDILDARSLRSTVRRRTAGCTKNLHRTVKPCGHVRQLRFELKQVAERVRLDGEIHILKGEIKGLDPKGKRNSDGPMNGFLAAIAAVTGVRVSSGMQLRIFLLMMMTELGAYVLPLVRALVSGHAERQPERRRKVPEIRISGSSGKVKEHVRLVELWWSKRVVEIPGAQTAAADLFADLLDFHGAKTLKNAGLSNRALGIVLGQHMGMNKTKAGKAWTVHYLGMILRSPVVRTSSVNALAGVSCGGSA